MIIFYLIFINIRLLVGFMKSDMLKVQLEDLTDEYIRLLGEQEETQLNQKEREHFSNWLTSSLGNYIIMTGNEYQRTQEFVRNELRMALGNLYVEKEDSDLTKYVIWESGQFENGFLNNLESELFFGDMDRLNLNKFRGLLGIGLYSFAQTNPFPFSFGDFKASKDEIYYLLKNSMHVSQRAN